MKIQMSVKSQKYSELDIGGRETCLEIKLMPEEDAIHNTRSSAHPY